MKKVRLTLVAAVLECAVACSGTVEGDGGALGAVEGTTNWSALPIIGEVLRTSPDQVARAVDEANARLTDAMATCMVAKGYAGYDMGLGGGRGVVLVYLARPMSLDAATTRGLYVLEDLKMLQTESNAQEELPPLPPAGSATEDPRLQLDAQAQCMSSREVQDFSSVNAFLDRYRADVFQDPKISSAVTEWRLCMEAAGWPGISVEDVKSRVLGSDDDLALINEWAAASVSEKEAVGSKIFEREVAAAKAVVSCDEQHYFPVMEHWKDLETSFLEQNSDEWNDMDPRLKYGFVTGLAL